METAPVDEALLSPLKRGEIRVGCVDRGEYGVLPRRVLKILLCASTAAHPDANHALLLLPTTSPFFSYSNMSSFSADAESSASASAATAPVTGFSSSEELPLTFCMGGTSDDGLRQTISDVRRKELLVFTQLLNVAPNRILNETIMALNDAARDPGYVGETEAVAVVEWWKSITTKIEITLWWKGGKHTITPPPPAADESVGEAGDEDGLWKCGNMGSRWTDVRINGRECRMAFYSRKLDGSHIFRFYDDSAAAAIQTKKYIIEIDPTN